MNDQKPENCLDVRRLLLADPARPLGTLDLHVQGCVKCQAFTAQLHAMEANLRHALEVPVPDGLAERILLQRQLKTRRLWQLRALAASFVVTCASLFSGQVLQPPKQDWAALAAAHVAGEPTPTAVNESLSEHELLDVLQEWELTLSEPLGDLLLLERCPIGQGRGLHAVFDIRGAGRIALILPPREVVYMAGSGGKFGSLYAAVITAGGRDLALVADNQPGLTTAQQIVSRRLVSANRRLAGV